MLLKSLKLKNIRSYVDEAITFPQGILLLAGDIGSGKSTILLAIEFAFFGLLRGELSGTSLLRNGAREGTVELTFELNDNTYTIGRTLKRTKTSVEQDAGFVVENGLRRELTATELKSWALQLLGYPADLVTKNKSLIYRYTVYTPQEEMKRIILEDQETRLAVLRKVFDIDKYKRIADNASTYAKLLRERKRTYEGQLLDEPIKKQQLADKQKQSQNVQKALLDIQPRLNDAKQTVLQQKNAIARLETERLAIAQHRAALDSSNTELNTLARHQNQIQSETARIKTLLDQSAPSEPPSAQDHAQMLKNKQDELARVEQELKTHIAARSEIITTRSISENTINKIIALNECPFCLQPVETTHKHALAEQEQNKSSTLLAQQAKTEEALQKNERVKKLLQQDIQTIQQQQAATKEAQLRYQHQQQNLQRKQQLDAMLAETTNSIIQTEQRKKQATEAIQAAAAMETTYLAEKSKLDTLSQHEQAVVVQHATLIEQAKALRETITILQNDLTIKQNARAKLDQLNAYHQWTTEFFASLMSVIEKHVMAKVYHDFNALFQDWFSILIQDNILQARLDEAFTPVLQQNGYDTLIENLSGGEKTACALAYRLALHKVVTSLHSTIKTKDLLILDEPTDGFSADQISRMREVLERVRARQVVLVSHEAMIESVADHVLRVAKDEHVSTIAV